MQHSEKFMVICLIWGPLFGKFGIESDAVIHKIMLFSNVAKILAQNLKNLGALTER